MDDPALSFSGPRSTAAGNSSAAFADGEGGGNEVTPRPYHRGYCSREGDVGAGGGYVLFEAPETIERDGAKER